MNLQPIRPPLTASGIPVYIACTNCAGRAASDTGFADLDAAPGTYYCAGCVSALSARGESARAEFMVSKHGL